MGLPERRNWVVTFWAPDEGGSREEVAFLLYLNDATFVGDAGRAARMAELEGSEGLA